MTDSTTDMRAAAEEQKERHRERELEIVDAIGAMIPPVTECTKVPGFRFAIRERPHALRAIFRALAVHLNRAEKAALIQYLAEALVQDEMPPRHVQGRDLVSHALRRCAQSGKQ